MNKKLFIDKTTKIFSLIMAIVLTVAVFAVKTNADTKTNHTIAGIYFEGEGTKENPYLISDLEDVSNLRTFVNAGLDFSGDYFLMTNNIDCEGITEEPIGRGERPFGGVFDGNGYYFKNVSVASFDEYVAFFGTLSGTIVNLGLENGDVYGEENVAGIAGRMYGDGAAILNCYSKLVIHGNRCAGIANYLAGGVIASCFASGELFYEEAYGIITYGGDVKLYHDYIVDGVLTATTDVVCTTCGSISRKMLDTPDFVSTMNKSATMTQVMYGNARNVELKQWGLNEKGKIGFSEEHSMIDAMQIFNLYFIPVVLMIGIAVLALRIKNKKEDPKNLSGVAIVSGIISLFFDCAAIGKGISYLNPGNIMFLILINGLFIWTTYICKKRGYFAKLPKFSKDLIPLLLVILFVVVVEVAQFNRVPRFDAHLYYGSLTRAIDNYQLDFITYITDFVCWKWVQGLIFVVAPFEFLFPGQMIGMYVANVFVSVATIVSLYYLLMDIGKKMTPALAAVTSLLLFLCPYELGLFTYLCMDSHIALFLVWLLISYRKKNHVMVSFVGYLLAFNKITGLVFYVLFLVCVAVYEVLKYYEGNIIKRIFKWWNWKTVILWVFPAILFMMSMVFGDHFTSQVFYGTYVSDSPYGLKELRPLVNTFMQSFVYAFRWIFVLLFVIAIVKILVKKIKISDYLSDDGIKLMAATIISCIGCFGLLCFYKGDAECPRYTATFNIFYAFSFPFLLQIIFDKKNIRNIVCSVVMVLMTVQLFWTIDPSIVFTTNSMDTGRKQLYKLAWPNDYRLAMALGTDYGRGYEIMGDVYAYNLEYGYYDDLLDKMLDDIDPTEETEFICLDVAAYEFHLIGNHYRIYWNPVTRHRNYATNDANNIFLIHHSSVTTDMLYDEEIELPDSFYLYTPGRVDINEAVKCLDKLGYDVTYSKEFSNIYGSMTVYGFTRVAE